MQYIPRFSIAPNRTRLESNSAYGLSDVTSKPTTPCAPRIPLRAHESFEIAFCGNSQSSVLQNYANSSSLINDRRVRSEKALLVGCHLASLPIIYASSAGFGNVISTSLENIRRGFAAEWLLISLRNASPKSFSFCSPTPGMRRNSVEFVG